MKRTLSEFMLYDGSTTVAEQEDQAWTASVTFTERVVQASPPSKRVKAVVSTTAQPQSAEDEETPALTGVQLTQPTAPQKPHRGLSILIPAQSSTDVSSPSPTLSAELERTQREERRLAQTQSLIKTIPLAQRYHTHPCKEHFISLDFLGSKLPPQADVIDLSSRDLRRPFNFYEALTKSPEVSQEDLDNVSSESCAYPALSLPDALVVTSDTSMVHLSIKRLDRLLQKKSILIENKETNLRLEGSKLECLTWLETVHEALTDGRGNYSLT